MSATDSQQSLYNLLWSKIATLNLFDTKSTDPVIIHREILSTRLFLILFFFSILIITIYLSFIVHIQTKTIQLPTQIEYEELLKEYPDNLQCPCTQISILHGEFTQITPSFHQVCSSDFVSQRWIDFVFGTNTTFVWPMDVRTSMSAMWQLIAALCQYANNTFIDTLNEFANTPLISSMILSENVLQIEIETSIELTRQTASDYFFQSITTIDQITQASGLLSGLSTNFISLLPTNGWQPFTYLYTGQNRYIRSGSNIICYCQNDRSCPMPGNIYLYKSWETYGLYNLTKIIANETLPGLIVDCLPIQMALSSSLECFYNQSCLNILISSYSKSINISKLDQSLSTRFFPQTNIKTLVNEFFLEQLSNKIIFKSYYQRCNPSYCTYTISNRFDLLYIITSIIGLVGGLNVALRLITPYLIDFLLKFKNRTNEQGESKNFKMIIFYYLHLFLGLTIRIYFKNLLNKIKLSIIELNVFNSHSQNIIQINHERISTRLYIILLSTTISILIFYTLLSTQTVSHTIHYPSQNIYEQLQNQYSNTLKCPCEDITIDYKDIIEINPIYHQLCSSDFIQSWWYKQLVTSTGEYIPSDFRVPASSYFQMLSIFCELSNLTFFHTYREFSLRKLITNQVFSRHLFNSQIESLINIFLNSLRIDFIYKISMINTILHANQYVTFTQTNAILVTIDLKQLGISSTNPLQVFPVSASIIQEDNSTCICARNSSCIISNTYHNLGKVDGIRTGCFIIDTVLQSSLICWFSQTCLKGLQQSFISVGINISNNISLLDQTLSSRFLLNSSFETILQEMIIEQWNTSVSFENYYQKCHPIYCTYTYQQKSTPIFIITIIIGFFGGLNVVLRLISPLFIKICSNFIHRIRSHRELSSPNTQEHRFYNWPILFFRQIREKLFTLNVFDNDSDGIDKIYQERLSTRLYLLLLMIILFIQITFNIILNERKSETNLMPTQNQYENLLLLYPDRLQCPCMSTSLAYKKFLTIDTSFHQICSSDFVSNVWLNFLFGDGFWGFQIKSDLRGRGSAYFQFLSTLCDLSKTTSQNAIDKFLEDIFVNAQIISENEFLSKMNLILDRFKTNTPYKFAGALQLIRDITHGNSFISTYLLNYEWNIIDNRSNATVSVIPVSPNKFCSCGTRSDCSNSGGIYRPFDNMQIFSMSGFNVGCSTVETLFRSTFECLYNQTCIDQLQYFAIFLGQYQNATKFINAMNSTYTTRFLLNTTIVDIANQLFIEQWKINISYSLFYQNCAPAYCLYTIEARNDFIYIFTRILAIYGGLTIALRLTSPYIIKLIFSLKKCCQKKNTIVPNAE